MMNPAIPQGERAAAPAVLRFEARLFRRSETDRPDAQALLDVPAWVSRRFAVPGAAKVEGVMNGQPFRTVMAPDGSGGHCLHVNKAMREGAGADAGDTVRLAILGPEPEPAAPADFRDALAEAAAEARVVWEELALLGRLDWIRWIESARKPATRARRIMRAVEQLSEGTRRPCCVNVYEFMLNRIREDEQARTR